LSYDLYLLDPEPGVEPYEQLERLDAEELSASPDPAIQGRNRRLVEALRDADPRYEESQLNYDVLAEQQGISVDEAKARNRSIQLTAEDGLEINLYDHHADITFPYWESLDAEALTRDIASASSVIATETGWKLYDPQLERVIDPAADASEIRRMFDVGREHVQTFIAEQERKSNEPLWKRLFRRD
jgi:hypothetical protein